MRGDYDTWEELRQDIQAEGELRSEESGSVYPAEDVVERLDKARAAVLSGAPLDHAKSWLPRAPGLRSAFTSLEAEHGLFDDVEEATQTLQYVDEYRSPESGDTYDGRELQDRVQRAQDTVESDGFSIDNALSWVPRGRLRDEIEALLTSDPDTGPEAGHDIIEKWMNDAYAAPVLNERQAQRASDRNYGSTAAAMENLNTEWQDVRQRAMNADPDGLIHDMQEGGREITYAEPGNPIWDVDWVYFNEGHVDSAMTRKIHYTSDDPVGTGYVTTVAQQALRSKGTDFHVKVDAENPYEFHGNEKHTMVLYVNEEDLDDSFNTLERMREERDIEPSDIYKEVDQPDTYSREGGFVVR